MNQGRIWCVVKPTVGLPLLLGSVAVTALIVHYSVLSHASWYGAYLEGGKNKKVALENSVSPVALTSHAVPGYVISVAPATDIVRTGSSFVVTVAPAPAPAQEQAQSQSSQAVTDDVSMRPLDKVSLATLAPSDEK